MFNSKLGQILECTSIDCVDLTASSIANTGTSTATTFECSVPGSQVNQCVRIINSQDSIGPTRWAFANTVQGGGSEAGFDLQLVGYSDDGVNQGYVCSYDRSDGSTRHRGAVLSNADGTAGSPSSGIGYASVAGTVTQATNKSTPVTINTITGNITTNNASLGSNQGVDFQVNCSALQGTDLVVANLISGYGSATNFSNYTVTVGAVAAGNFRVTVYNNSGGSLSDALVIRYAIIRSS
jgi:hypothetical protein